MLHNVLFIICNVLAVLGWVALICFPSRRVTRFVARHHVFPLAIAAIYMALIVSAIGQTDGGFFSLDDIALLFGHRTILLAGWIHYLAFDLAIGNFVLLNSQELGISHALMIPCLALTCWLGPIGFLLYCTIRGVRARRAA